MNLNKKVLILFRLNSFYFGYYNKMLFNFNIYVKSLTFTVYRSVINLTCLKYIVTNIVIIKTINLIALIITYLN